MQMSNIVVTMFVADAGILQVFTKKILWLCFLHGFNINNPND